MYVSGCDTSPRNAYTTKVLLFQDAERPDEVFFSSCIKW